MIDLALWCLQVAIEQRRVGFHTQLVRGLVDLDPPLPGALCAADGPADLPIKDLRPAPRQASQPRLAQLLQNMANALTTKSGEGVNLDGGPGLYVDGRVCSVQLPDDVQIHVETPIGMHAAGDVQLRNTCKVHPR